MQQTSKYQFNLVDATDDFSPEPLNQNAQKTEDKFAEVEADLADLVTEVGAGGHNCRIACGTYTGTGSYGSVHRCSIAPGFRPLAVFLATNQYTSSAPAVFIRGMSRQAGVQTGYNVSLSWSDTTVSWYDTGSALAQGNTEGYQYYYVVIGD